MRGWKSKGEVAGFTLEGGEEEMACPKKQREVNWNILDKRPLLILPHIIHRKSEPQGPFSIEHKLMEAKNYLDMDTGLIDLSPTLSFDREETDSESDLPKATDQGNQARTGLQGS